MANSEIVQPPIWPLTTQQKDDWLAEYGDITLKADFVANQELVPERTTDILSTVNFDKASQLIDSAGRTYALNGSLHPIREYWLVNSGINETDVNRLVDNEGRIIFQVPDNVMKGILELSETDPLQAGLQLIDELAPIYDPNGYSLSASIQGKTPDGKQKGIDGFNDHRRPHIRTVLRGAMALLDQAKSFVPQSHITPRVKQATALGTAIHDGINIWSRGSHATGITVLFPIITPELVKSRLWHDIAVIGVFHNESQAMELLNTLPKDHTLTDEINLLKELGPGTLAAIISDKLHIGQDRLPPEWRHSDGLLRDWNIAVNACFKTDEAGYTQDGKTFRVNMSYTAGPENDVNHPATVAPDGQQKDRFWMPDAIDAYMRNPDKNKRVAHSEVVEAMMWNTYKDRLRLTIMSAFALNPNAETVEFNISDKNARQALEGFLSPERIAKVEHRTYRFTREDIDIQFKAIEDTFGVKGKNIDLLTLKKAGEALLPVVSPTRRQVA